MTRRPIISGARRRPGGRLRVLRQGDREMRKAVLFLAALSLLMQAAIADARVVKLVIEKTRPFADGKSFGDTGPYERLDGTVYLEVDPRDPRNAVIINLDKVPRNAR